MKRILYSTILGILLSAGAAFSAQQTWTGQITDSMCGKDHSMMQHGGKKVSARDCTLECVKAGAKYAFVSNGAVYEIQNQDLKDLTVHAGHTVKLTGEMSADKKSIKVDKIEMPAGKKKS
jgi:hypothetical protein